MTIDAIKRKTNEVANRAWERLARLLGDGRRNEVGAIIKPSDVVLAVWQDAAQPGGLGVKLIKGQARLRKILASGTVDEVRLGAVPCVEPEQAEVLLQVMGEPDRGH